MPLPLTLFQPFSFREESLNCLKYQCHLGFLSILQMQMAELLVSHGASLSARTSLDEMPIGEFMQLKERNA